MIELKMKTITEQKPKELTYFYRKGLAFELEKHLHNNGIYSIGDENIGRNKRLMGNSKVRQPLWEPAKDERAMRTLLIKGGLYDNELKLWQEHEKKNCRYLLCNRRELKGVIRPKIKFPDVKWNDQFIDHVMEYVKKHHPQYKKFQGFPVPPYFNYDIEFDGMEFEHALDWKIFYGEPINYSGFYEKEGKNPMFQN